MKLLPCGEHAILVELPDAEARRALNTALRAEPVAGIREFVPAAQTVLLHLDEPSVASSVAAAVRGIDLAQFATGADTSSKPVEVPVRYDGEDLDEVASILGITADEVVKRHTGQVWDVEFAGFMPGFGYLSGENNNLTVPRRESPRTRIPAGAVALAGDFTGIYPQASPGGWQLIGNTDVTLWDVDATPPALLTPGVRIQFVDVTEGAS